MEKEFVPYELAVKLKDFGFDEECFTCYCNHWKDMKPYLWELNQPDYGEYWDLNSKVNAPLWQQAFDWFRDENNLPNWVYESTGQWYFRIVKGDFWIEHREVGYYKSYEEARLECLRKLIEITENKS